MYASIRKGRLGLILKSTLGSILLAGVTLAFAAAEMVMLSGNDEVPPVTTAATGSVTIQVNADKTVTGSVATTGMAGTAAHVHEGAVGKNGPVVITLSKSSDGIWAVPEGAKLTDAQYESYKAGNLYVNVHSAANKNGEIRAQLKP